MKIFVVYPYVPYPLDRGTYQRTYHLLTELARCHEVTFLALAEHGQGMEHREKFEKICSRVEFVPFEHPPWARLFPTRLLNPLPASIAHWTVRSLAERIDQILDVYSFDAVHVCDIVMAQYFRRARIPLIIDRSRIDLQFQLAEHSRMNFSSRTQLLRGEGYLKLWFYEREIASRSALQIVCGPDDKQFIRRWINPSVSIEVLVNGVDLEYFSPKAVDVPRSALPTVLFCGTMDYSPNVQALRWYFEEIHEPLRNIIPDLQVLIVGKEPLPEVRAYAEKAGVVVTGGVPDVRPYYRQAWLQIVPLRIGGGTRLKIVESMAMGTPVVSTSLGAQGLALKHNYHVLLADSANEFVRETAKALLDESLRNRLELAGQRLTQSQFSWKTIGEQLNQIYSTHMALVGVEGAGRAATI